MFDRRKDLLKLLTVAETGAILAAADKLSMTQPALSRTISKLEEQFKGQLFDRVPTGVRLTQFGSLVLEQSMRILREIETAEDRIEAVISGQSGNLRVSAGPMWMKTILPATATLFHADYPGITLKLRTTSYQEGLWLLMGGEIDLHCGGIDTCESLPQFIAREHMVDMTWGIVAHKDHPLHSGETSCEDLADYPWIDFDVAMVNQAGIVRPSLTENVLDSLYKQTGRNARVVIRTNSVDLSLMETGPYLSVLSLNFIDRLPGEFLQPLPLQLGHHACRTGILSRKSSAAMSSCRHFIKVIRDVVMGRAPI